MAGKSAETGGEAVTSQKSPKKKTVRKKRKTTRKKATREGAAETTAPETPGDASKPAASGDSQTAADAPESPAAAEEAAKKPPKRARRGIRKKAKKSTTSSAAELEAASAKEEKSEAEDSGDTAAETAAAAKAKAPAQSKKKRRKKKKATTVEQAASVATKEAVPTVSGEVERTSVAETAASEVPKAEPPETPPQKQPDPAMAESSPPPLTPETVAEKPAAPTPPAQRTDAPAPAPQGRPGGGSTSAGIGARMERKANWATPPPTQPPPAPPRPSSRRQSNDQPFGFGLGVPDAEPKPAAPVQPPVTADADQGRATQKPAAQAPPDADAHDRKPPPDAPAVPPQEQSGQRTGRKRRRRRRGSGDRGPQAAPPTTEVKTKAPEPPDRPAEAPAPAAAVEPHPVRDEHGEKHDPARLVMKPRPVRRARRGRKRRRGGEEQRSETAAAATETGAGGAEPAGVSEEPPPAGESSSAIREAAEVIELAAEQEKAPAPSKPQAEAEAPPETKKADEPPKKTGKRKRRRKKAATPAVVEAAEEEQAAEAEAGIAVIDETNAPQKPLHEGREMIINVTAGAECRIAILENGRLEELYIERQSAASHVGNIYIGKVTNVEPSIQAAFVDFGLAKNGFLHISDVQPKYFPNRGNEPESVGKKVPRRDRPPIQKCFRRGDRLIVQVVKEGVGTKGPTLTTYLSIPGRFMVMMPGMDKLGVSRKIEDDAERRQMRELLNELTLPDGMGFILRTAGLNRNKRELQSDLNYLSRLWKTVEDRIATQTPPCELYQESDLVIRTIRDIYSSDFKRIVVDDASTAAKAREFLRIAMPRTPAMVVEYRLAKPIFHYYGIEQEIERIHSRTVPLASGGSLVIESTEAMVTIDVNSGKFRDLNDAEETAFRIDLEAAEEIARQLRLRDLGGLVVCDFIDLRMDRHKRAVEKALRDALKKHKERARILRMSKFGIIEMTRQRQRQSIKRSIFVDCPDCGGSGLVKTAESMSLEVARLLQLHSHRSDVAKINVTVAPKVATLLLNARRAFLHEQEQRTGKSIAVIPDPTYAHDQVSFECSDYRGMPVRVDM